MQFSSGYVPYLLQAEHSIANDLGVDVLTTDPQTYRTNLLTLSLVGMVMKAIQDLSPAVATDAWWQQRLNIAVDTGPNGDRSGWLGWVLLQMNAEQLAVYGATTSDTFGTVQAKMAAYNAGQHAAQQSKAAH